MNKALSLDPLYDELLVSLHQLDAVLDVVTSADFTELNSKTVSNYLWVARDILNKAKSNCELLANFAHQSLSEDINHAD